MKVESLHQYPLTGAQAVTKASFDINAGGILDDRRFVLYDETIDPSEAPNRVSQKEIRALATFGARYVGNGLRMVFDGNVLTVPVDPQSPPNVEVNEFGDVTPAIDMGSTIAKYFQELFQRPHLRLAQKSAVWARPTIEEATNRINAPFHIVTAASVKELQQRGESTAIDARRFRPSIVIAGNELEAFEELTWLDRVLRIGEAAIVVTRATDRCKVTGHDQATGENKKDVPKLYNGLPKGPTNKPVFGVYGYAMIGQGKTRTISRDDEVTLDL